MSDREEQIERMLSRLAGLDEERNLLSLEIARLSGQTPGGRAVPELEGLPLFDAGGRERFQVDRSSPDADKIALFIDLFGGRPDVYAERWENSSGSRSGYSFACGNVWKPGLCGKPARNACRDCVNRAYLPFTGEVVRSHLRGTLRDGKGKEFVAGVYPILMDNSCRFIVADFDKEEHREDARAFKAICVDAGIPVHLERSRSGNGVHAWVFFTATVPARSARRMMAAMITRTMDARPDLGFASYDRMIPNQDQMPKGGFGNLVALPLQQRARARGNSAFVNEDWEPFEDQWEYLSNARRMTPAEVELKSQQGVGNGTVIGLRYPVDDEHSDTPWHMKPSRPITPPKAVGLVGGTISMTLGDQIYIERSGLPAAAVAQFARIGAYQNPKFYLVQNLRKSTWDVPRVISAAEIHPKHISLPRGCYDEAVSLARDYGAAVEVVDVRNMGNTLPAGVAFKGTLRPRQQLAYDSLMAHDIGMLKAPPAFGKTVVSIALIAGRNRNTLIIVFTRTVFDQWRARLRTFLEIDHELIGWIGGGKFKPTGVVDVALIHTLAQGNQVADIVADYGHVIVDEAHHMAAASFEPVGRRAKARYFLAASATPKRKDGHHPSVYMNLGPIRYQVDARQMIAESGMAHVYRQRLTGFRFPMELADLVRSGEHHSQDVYKALAEDEPRNYMIFDDVLRAMDRGRCPIVLTSRKDHLDNLYERFRKHVKNVVVLKGAMKARERRLAEELLSKPPEEERLILATGQFLGEGFDDPRLDALFMTMPTVWEGTLEQYAGRLQRQYFGKFSVEVTDYTDNEDSLMRKAEARMKVFRRIGFTVDAPESAAPYMDA